MKEDIKKIAGMLNAILKQQGINARKNAVVQTLDDFENSISREIKRDLDNYDYDDIEDLKKNKNVFVDLKNQINENRLSNKIECKKSFERILDVYNYYENKYVRELEYRNSEQRKNYIETILSPLLVISMYFEEEIVKNNNKLRASIFQKNILKNNDYSQFVLNIENSLVEINNCSIKIYNEEILILNSSLLQKEVDFNTTTFHGQFQDGTLFRVIRPNDIPLANIKSKYNCVSSFTMASIEPDGYAIHFILTDINDIRNHSVVEKGKEEQIQRLLEGCILALQNKLFSNFIDYSKRILAIVNNVNELHKYEYGTQILLLMNENIELFSDNEKVKIAY